ncbi:YihY/virulence factor BrkB family protein [Chryseosolibacter indicus]|uniref:YihY/virulence factor BrkB family protein n=1 Tax=Chryseosolibacter indicus TaxID=2782351 RepID=A0ABS5VNR7_9BACT|nr:YihY/virulence factor BrkB family protein [Chryseosolibacter indicus]MBT1702427.1 YihY/virulence factor BrkB family protein [Chryseosolibacter indicus]
MRKWLQILRQAGTEFLADNGMKLSASLSYYTVFSLGPVLIIIISLAGIFFGRDAVQGKLYYQLNGLLGNDAALQIQQIIQNIEKSQFTTSGAVLGVVALVIGATGVFAEIQDSINYIWSLKAKPKQGWLKLLMNRFISFSLIVSFGFLLMVSLAVHALMDLLDDKLERLFDDATVYIFQGINYLILYAVITTLFAIIFKVLPDGTIRWKDAFIGAAFTAVLFLIGKFLISFYLGSSDVDVTYGAAASIVIILLWVYYTSIILYFGAEFTKVYTLNLGKGITPNETAVFIIKQEVKELHTHRKN